MVLVLTINGQVIGVFTAVAALLQVLRCRHDVGYGVAAKEGVHVRGVGSRADDGVYVFVHDWLVKELRPSGHGAGAGQESKGGAHHC